MDSAKEAEAGQAEFVDVDTGAHYQLASNALGLPQVLFCIVTGAAPIAAMLFNTPVVVLGGGFAVPAAFLIATIVLTIFSVGYIEMARKVTAAGGFYSFVTHGFGPIMGMGTAVLITACYMVFSAAVIGVTSYFANTSILDWTNGNVDIPVWVIMFSTLAIMAVLAFFHVELTAKILGVFLISELAGLLIFGFAVLFQGGDNGIPMDAINPANLWADDNTAILGASATGIALFGAFWSWVGFEMAPNYAEESREPKKIMAPATYISVVGLGLLYMFITWMFVAGWGQENVAAGVLGPVQRRVRLGLLPADHPVRRRVADDGLRGPDHHGLVRLPARVLQHGHALPLLDGPRGHPAALARPHAPDAPQPVHRRGRRDACSSGRTCSASCSTTRARSPRWRSSAPGARCSACRASWPSRRSSRSRSSSTS